MISLYKPPDKLDRNLWKMLHIDYPSQIWNPMRDEKFNTIEKKIL